MSPPEVLARARAAGVEIDPDCTIAMTPAAIIAEAAADGVSLTLSPTGTIKATGDPAAVNRWLPVLRARKPALVAEFRACLPALERPDIPGELVAAAAGLPKARAPVNLEEALAAACDAVAGITPAQFRALLSPEDITDIEAGGIHPKTLKAYAVSFAASPRPPVLGAGRNESE